MKKHYFCGGQEYPYSFFRSWLKKVKADAKEAIEKSQITPKSCFTKTKHIVVGIFDKNGGKTEFLTFDNDVAFERWSKIQYANGVEKIEAVHAK